MKNVIIILVGLFQEQGALVSVFNILVVVMAVVTEYLLVLCWYLVACFSPKKQTYHDMLFGTIVVNGNIK
nr:hypothetical protein [Wolbachia endosymbiont of Atemnus politus]